MEITKLTQEEISKGEEDIRRQVREMAQAAFRDGAMWVYHGSAFTQDYRSAILEEAKRRFPVAS